MRINKQNVSLVAALCLGLAAVACGDDGAAGPAGPAGDPGAPGAPGMDGTNGTDGTNGADGNPGESGDPGMNATAFDFRTDAPSDYTRVDRMGQPAVSTALVSTNKAAYQAADPADDVEDDLGNLVGAGAVGQFIASDIAPNLSALHAALADDFTGAGLTACTDSGSSFDPVPCATQSLLGPATATPLDLIVPDTLIFDPEGATGYPNGRHLDDPVIDIILAAILLDVGGGSHTVLDFVNLYGAGQGLNPGANDVPNSASFPYLAFPHTP